MNEPRPSVRRGPRRAVAAVAVAVVGVIASLLTARAVVEPGVSIDVDFAAELVAVPRQHIGFTATTFDVEGGAVPRNAGDISALGQLGAGAVRIHLRGGPDGSVVTGAEGGIGDIAAEQWLETYAGMGAELTVIVDLDLASAMAVLTHVRAAEIPVERFVVGNEMDANSRADVSPEEYVARFREIAKSMRSVDPSLQIGGPAPAYFEGLSQELVDGLVRAPREERASFIDFHAYGAGEGERATMASSWRYSEQLDRLRTMIDDPAVGLQVGEYNLNWSEEGQNNTQVQSVWVAAALGTILSRGAVAFQYGDKNSALGLVADGVPKASYWGIAAFTGASRFRPFGATMVRSTSSNSAVRVFASTRDKNIVIVNTGDGRSAGVTLRGFDGGRASVWQSASGEFRETGSIDVDSGIDLELAPMSITTVVLDDPGGAALADPVR